VNGSDISKIELRVFKIVAKNCENAVKTPKNVQIEVVGHQFVNALYLWLPGCSINHCKNGANISFVRTDKGVDLIACEDLEVGQELLADYNVVFSFRGK